MLAQTRLKLKNAESSVTFLQEQHAKTLEGLHEEIKQLQKKNARLTFDLAMIAPPGLAVDSTRCAGCQQLEEELVSSKADILHLSSALTTQKDNNTLVQHQLKELEVKYTEDLNSRDEALQSLNIDLEKKSNTVALITQQYHQLRARFHLELESNSQTNTTCTHCQHRGSEHGVNTDQEHSDYQWPQHQHRGNPIPPSGISKRTPATIQRRSFHRTTSSPVPCDVSSMSSIDSSVSNRGVPTPPISPRPPSYSSSPPLLRRASRPARRHTPSLGSTTNDSLSKHVLSRSHKSDGSRSTVSTPLDPVRKQKRGVLPSEISEILQSRKTDDHMHIRQKQQPPILPPILPDTINDQAEPVPLQTNQAYVLSSSSFKTTPPQGQPHRQHRHFILSRAQGLSSAPVRAMRVLCYGQAGLDHQENAQVEEEDSEGMLLVKEAVSCEDQTWQELHQQGTDR